MQKIIAIDGVSASGKGTLGRKIANALDFAYLDTGKLYRAAGWYLWHNGLDAHETAKACEFIRDLDVKILQQPDLALESVAKYASILSAEPTIRHALLEFQRNFAKNSPNGAILDGRDIGTIICPDAPIKFYIIADAKIRAHRRFLELQSLQGHANEDLILADLLARDDRDMNRAIAPLKPAVDSFHLDTSQLTPDQCLELALRHVKTKQPDWF